MKLVADTPILKKDTHLVCLGQRQITQDCTCSALFGVAREGVVLRYAAFDAVLPQVFSRAANATYTQSEVRVGRQHGR